MLTTTEDTLTAFPAPGTIICACDEDAACAFHAAALYGEQPVTVDTADTERRSFEDASADFYIPGWTPDDVDTREHDRKILADMTAEAHDNPDMAHALRTLYGDDTFTAADLAAMMKHDAKDWGSNEGEG
jgi:hypothetical protein